MADGFLGRWSRRKLDARDGKPLEPEAPPELPPPSRQPAPASVRGSEAAAATPAPPPGEGRGEGSPPPPPTLEDAHALTPESDFTRFTRGDVDPQVKNAAMKKLFADPRYNIQDGLDVYIDDYGKPDPLPESMLRQLASAKFMGLFREEERTDEQNSRARDDAEAQAGPSVAQSPSPPAVDEHAGVTPAVPPDHADPDLRLQQDDAAGPGGRGRGTG